MVVDNIHDHPKAAAMKGLDHFLKLPDAHRAIGGIGGVGSLRNIIIYKGSYPQLNSVSAPASSTVA